MSRFIDWLSVSQDHPQGCRVLGSDYVVHTDPDTGEVTREHVIGFQHEGSFDTSLRIRSDGYRVEISGNPSRYNRPDNVFGYETVDECMAVYNAILRSVGLPEFTKGTPAGAVDCTKSGAVKIIDGARFSRVDISRNYATGSSASASLALRGLSACSRRGEPWEVAKSGMVHTGNRRYARAKYYDKALEMRVHGRKKAAQSDYRDAVQQWCAEEGVIRFEVELGRDLLIQRKMNGWILWNDDRAKEIAASYDKVNEMSFATNDYQHIAADLEHEFGLKPTRALKAQHAALAWLSGEDLRESMSKSAFYRVTADLKLVGIDARAPCNVAALAVRVRVVDVAPAVAPSWYQFPKAA
ncbi:phage/plasmid replication domain-containing protein [Salinisphaera hydrothermalis]|uniref:phage/plasmid replication domain-containing protein n=1 Tax=Salinisphaera hydrothermalis TaxID=563188 RepID=UPI0033406DA0